MSHTWPLSYTYARCPKCGTIFLDRSLPVKKNGTWEREFQCPSCHAPFSEKANPWSPPDTSDWLR